jgi:hypothetical protein
LFEISNDPRYENEFFDKIHCELPKPKPVEEKPAEEKPAEATEEKPAEAAGAETATATAEVSALMSNLSFDLVRKLTEGSSTSLTCSGPVNLETFLKQIDFREVYNYDGSFTTPPCTEGINWFVVKKPIQISQR